MAGLISGPLTDGVAEQALGSDAFQSTTGEFLGAVAGQAWNALPSVEILHHQQQYNEAGPAVAPTFPVDGRNAGSDVDAMAAERGPAPVRNTIQPDEANARAKAAGADVTFDAPIADTHAQSVIDDHLTAQKRAKTIANYQGGIMSGAAAFGIESLIGLADPINLAAFAIPVAPEGFVAERLAQAAGAFERTAIRAGAGAVNGAAGMAALQPLQYSLSKADYNDYTLGDALHQILFGAVMGGAGHALLGGIFGKDYIPTRNPAVADAAGRAAIGQVLDGRPVDVADIVNYGDATAAREALDRFHAAQQRAIDQADAVRSAARSTSGAVGPTDMAPDIAAATENLSALREHASRLRGDIEAAQAKAVEGGLDPDSAARLGDINHELGGVIPRARRAALEQERTMLMEGRGNIDVPTGDALEQGRTAAQVKGLSTAADRAEADTATAEKHLADLKKQAADAEAAAEANRTSASRAERIAQAKLDSQSAVVQSLIERQIRKYAANLGVALPDGEVATIAREIRTAQPAEAADTINAHLSAIAKRGNNPTGKMSAAEVEEMMNPPGSRPTGPLSAEAQAAAQSMAARTTADRPVTASAQHDAQINRTLVETAPKLAANASEQLTETTKMVQELHNQLQGEIKSGRITETQAMRDEVLRADETEKMGKAAANYAQCLVARGF